MTQNKIKRELIFFIISGCTAVATDAGVYFGLRHIDLNVNIAKSLSFCAGSFAAFVLNRAFTFQAKGAHGPRILKFTLLYLSTLAINTFVNKLALDVLSATSTTAAFLLATSVSTVLNFVGQKFFVFSQKA